jgi:hypothetical protein
MHCILITINCFLADNDKNGAQNEFIFAIAFDIHTQTYGGTTFLTHAPVGGSMDASTFGINGGWEVSERQQLC